MKQLPTNAVAYQRTPEFCETTIPAGLRRAHSTKAGVWGLIVITHGSLNYKILEPNAEQHELTVDLPGVVEPTVLHEVQAIEPVQFYVEFYRLES